MQSVTLIAGVYCIECTANVHCQYAVKPDIPSCVVRKMEYAYQSGAQDQEQKSANSPAS